MVGKIISHYKILEKLGEGGMGIVYKAFDSKLERTVALKLLRSETLGDHEAKKRLMREAKAASALNHSNITTIHGIDNWHGRDFICMEYVEGQTLREKIKSKPLTIDEIVAIAAQIADALKQAHDQDIIHRDIKSNNIMVTEKGQVKVMDFGLAKRKGTGTVTKLGTTMGTVAYMSPEQTQGEKVDFRTDIWSFGVVLYEMITGQLPFKGDYDQAVIYSILNEEPKPMSGLRTDLPQELELIVNTAIAKNSEKRYQSADVIKVDLKKSQQDIDTGKNQTIKSATAISAKQNNKRRTTTSASLKNKQFRLIVSVAVFLFLVISSFIVYQLLTKEIEVEDKTVAIMFFENQTGDKAFDQHSNNLIPLIYDKLFANHKNDLKLPSPSVKNQLKSMQESNSFDFKTAEKFLNDAKIKYRVTAIIQKSGDNLNYILETTKPGKHPLVWQETISRPDSATPEVFAKTLADWIEACVWVDGHEERIHKEFNYDIAIKN